MNCNGCGFTNADIKDSAFSCCQSNPDSSHVVFTATVSETGQTGAPEIVNIISEWKDTSPDLNVESVNYVVSKDCDALLTGDQNCACVEPSTGTEATIIPIIIGVSVGSAFLVIILVTIISLLIFRTCRYTMKDSYDTNE